MKLRHLLYIIVVFAICLVPSAGIAFTGVSETAGENRTLAGTPKLRKADGSVNQQFFADAGDWFEDHFALRGELVTANARVRSEVFQVSAQDSVIRGTDGWLYYTDSLEDHQGRNLLSGRELFNLAHTLGMVQRSLEAAGVRFLFAVAPNKNSIYPEHMPWYDNGIASEENNLDHLVPYLEEEGVLYADLKGLLQEAAENSERELYHQRDSHWTGEGAFLAARKMMDTIGKPYFAQSTAPFEIREDFEGDLAGMLYPTDIVPDDEVYYTDPQIFAYVTETQSTFDGWIQAINPSREDSLLMYRDSFGNALVPFFAQEYLNAYFDRGEPYDMTKAATLGADTVILVRAERFLEHLTGIPPVLPAAAQEIDLPVREDGDHLVKCTKQLLSADTICRIEGAVDPDLIGEDTRIFLAVGEADQIYEAFPCDITQILPAASAQEEDKSVTLESGFVLNLPAQQVPEGTKVRVLIKAGEEYLAVGTQVL